jgi:hypothetical protein
MESILGGTDGSPLPPPFFLDETLDETRYQ